MSSIRPENDDDDDDAQYKTNTLVRCSCYRQRMFKRVKTTERGFTAHHRTSVSKCPHHLLDDFCGDGVVPRPERSPHVALAASHTEHTLALAAHTHALKVKTGKTQTAWKNIQGTTHLELCKSCQQRASGRVADSAKFLSKTNALCLA